MNTFISHAHSSGKQTGTIKMAIWLLDSGRVTEALKLLKKMEAETDAEDAENKAKGEAWFNLEKDK